MFPAPLFRGAVAMAVALSLASLSAQATVLTFEDLPPSGPMDPLVFIPEGYGGFHWSQLGTTWVDELSQSGYKTVATDGGNHVVFNWNASPASFSADAPFSLNSASFAGAWNDGLTIDVTGYRDGMVVATKSFTVDTHTATTITFGWEGLTSVDLVSYGGAPNAAFTGYGQHFAMDNLDVTTAVPEASSAVLYGLGFVAIALTAAHRRRQSV